MGGKQAAVLRGDNMYDTGDLIERMRKQAKQVTTNGVELGVVTQINPLIIKIGDSEYDSTKWTIYEPYIEEYDVEAKEGMLDNASVDCAVSRITTLNYKTRKEKERKAKMKYKKGDLVAIQQMDGDTSFIILCKLKKVI